MNMLRVLNLRDQSLEALEPDTDETTGDAEEGVSKSKTALEIAKELAGTDAATCETGATANAKAVWLYLSASVGYTCPRRKKILEAQFRQSVCMSGV